MVKIAGCLQEGQKIDRSCLQNMLGYPLENLYFFEDSFLHLAAAESPLKIYKNCLLAFEGTILNEIELIQAAKKIDNNLSSNINEALITLYKRSKDAFIKEVEGEFVIILYDLDNSCFLIFRDRIGYLPLYWSQTQKGLLFGSDLKGLIASSLIFQKLNFEALTFYLYFGFIPQEKTPLENVFKLLPGHFLRYREGCDLEIIPYGSLAQDIKGKDIEDASSYSAKKKSYVDLKVQIKDLADMVWKIAEPIGSMYCLNLYFSCKNHPRSKPFEISNFTDGKIHTPKDPFLKKKTFSIPLFNSIKASSLKYFRRKHSFDFIRSLYTHPYHHQHLEEGFIFSSKEIEDLGSTVFKKLNTELFLHRFPAIHELGKSKHSLAYLFLKNQLPSLYLYSQTKAADSFGLTIKTQSRSPHTFLENLGKLFTQKHSQHEKQNAVFDPSFVDEMFNLLHRGLLVNSGAISQNFLFSLKKSSQNSPYFQEKIYTLAILELWMEQFIEKSPKAIAKKLYEENSFLQKS